MSRVSCDQYKTPAGELVNITSRALADTAYRQKWQLWNGYDYVRQEWVHEGKKDTRTLEELRAAMGDTRKPINV